MKKPTPLEVAKLAVKEDDVLYSPSEFRAILANLIEWVEKPVTVTGFAPGFEMPNDQLDMSVYDK